MAKRTNKSRTKTSAKKSAGKKPDATKRARTRSPSQRGPAAGDGDKANALATLSPAAEPAQETKKPVGRPPVSPDLLDRVLDRIANGEYLEDICKDEDMPSATSVRKYKRTDAKFASAYARAREDQMEAFEYMAACTARDGSKDWIVTEDQNGNKRETFNHEHVQRSKLIVDQLRWTMSKLFPALYGDRVAIDVNDATPLASTLNKAKARARAAGYALGEDEPDGIPETAH